MNKELIGNWKAPATITPNNFVYKSLSNWALNVAVGCRHGCGFCYVPKVSTIKLMGNSDAPGPLKKLGVTDADQQWGEYVYVRPWDEHAFRKSLRSAEDTPREKLKPDGNRAILLCSTTDAYQVTLDPEMNKRLRIVVRNSLEMILKESTLNVRILTRGPLATRDFDLMKLFGKRLTFGMSLPTLNDKLARVYEQNAPAPSQRLKTLRAAKDAGLHVFVAMAPTYPEQDILDLRATLEVIAGLDPITIFHEPINERAGNVERMRELAAEAGIDFKGEEMFRDRDTAAAYQLKHLEAVQSICIQNGLQSRMHLWPDKSLQGRTCSSWLQERWNRISEWPN